MEEIYSNIIIDNEDYILPYSNEWKIVYGFATDYLKKNMYENALKKLDNFVKILVVNGDVYEDVVMETAIYYFLCIKTNLKLSTLKLNNQIVEGVNTLLDNNFEKIFKNEDYKYLNKIVLSFLINELNNMNSNKIVKNVKITKDGQEIIKKYSKNCNGRLYRLLKSYL